MKITLTLVLLLVAQLSLAETLKERKVKKEMLNRVDSMIAKVEEARKALGKEDVVTTCKTINQLFKIYPDHLVAVGTNMNLLDGAVIKMENEVKVQLIYIHQQSNVCGTGEIGENLEMKEVGNNLKEIGKVLGKQKRKINKSDTNYQNNYKYYYEF